MLEKVPASERDTKSLTTVVVIALHLANLLTRDLPEKDSEEYITLHKAIAKLVRMNFKTKNVSRSTIAANIIILYITNMYVMVPIN